LCALAYYPASQAALAKTTVLDGELVAERFEIYYKGVELANGYHELADAKEQHKRLLEANEQRQSLGKDLLPIDKDFLEALEKGLPDCCGVAVGFDRLMMLKLGLSDISEVMPFAWDLA
jgi:lysyl-tRNA synthetase class 2